ncbi:MAG: hypothetical protein SVV03_02515 [Candidatus Nanohaloarchaea archaeon]|nr:hypothetical protein [Candidatus Nanohaloarchaea archaeon]
MIGAMSKAHAAKEEHLSHKSDGEPYDPFCDYCATYYHSVEIDETTHAGREYGFNQFKALCQEDLIVEEDIAKSRGEVDRDKIDCEECREVLGWD